MIIDVQFFDINHSGFFFYIFFFDILALINPLKKASNIVNVDAYIIDTFITLSNNKSLQLLKKLEIIVGNSFYQDIKNIKNRY